MNAHVCQEISEESTAAQVCVCVGKKGRAQIDGASLTNRQAPRRSHAVPSTPAHTIPSSPHMQDMGQQQLVVGLSDLILLSSSRLSPPPSLDDVIATKL